MAVWNYQEWLSKGVHTMKWTTNETNWSRLGSAGKKVFCELVQSLTNITSSESKNFASIYKTKAFKFWPAEQYNDRDRFRVLHYWSLVKSIFMTVWHQHGALTSDGYALQHNGVAFHVGANKGSGWHISATLINYPRLLRRHCRKKIEMLILFVSEFLWTISDLQGSAALLKINLLIMMGKIDDRDGHGPSQVWTKADFLALSIY